MNTTINIDSPSASSSPLSGLNRRSMCFRTVGVQGLLDFVSTSMHFWNCLAEICPQPFSFCTRRMVHIGRLSKPIKTGRHQPSITAMLMTKRPAHIDSGNTPQQGLESRDTVQSRDTIVPPKKPPGEMVGFGFAIAFATFQMPSDGLRGYRGRPFYSKQFK